MRAMIMAAVLMAASAGVAQAQSIERACLRSDRDASGQALCGCIQQAADLTLNARDQKMASSFYRSPQKAQDIRQSNRPAHVRFWQRYKDFLEAAQAFCS
jgi:hypothetical protein